MFHKIFGNSKQNLIAIDISSRFVKLLELENCSDSYTIVKFELQQIENIEISDQLKKLTENIPAKHKNVIFALPYNKIISKTIEVADLVKQDEIENFLLLNMQKYIGYGADKIDMDYEIQKKGKPNFITVQMAIAKKEQTKKIIAFGINANLNPTIIDVNAFALIRAIKFLIPENNQLAVMCVNINFDSIIICVLHCGEVIYIQEDYIEKSDSQNFQYISQALINAMQICFSQANVHIDRVILAGEAIFTVDVLTTIKKQLSAEIIVLNPFQKMSVADNINKAAIEKYSSFFVICCGLALRKFNHA